MVVSRRIAQHWGEGMKYSYKRIIWPDVELLRALLEVFAGVFEEPQTYLGAVPREEYFLEQERSEICIYDLGVRESHRRKGLATRLIQELKRIAPMRVPQTVFAPAGHMMK